MALDDFDIDEIRLEGVPTFRAHLTNHLDDSDRAHFKALVKQHVTPREMDVEFFCCCLCNVV